MEVTISLIYWHVLPWPALSLLYYWITHCDYWVIVTIISLASPQPILSKSHVARCVPPRLLYTNTKRQGETHTQNAYARAAPRLLHQVYKYMYTRTHEQGTIQQTGHSCRWSLTLLSCLVLSSLMSSLMSYDATLFKKKKIIIIVGIIMW